MSDNSPRPPTGLAWFAVVAVVLLVLRVIVGVMTAPPSLAIALTVITTILFIMLPVVALFKASEWAWTGKPAAAFLGIGVVLHLGGVLGINQVGSTGLPSVLLSAIAQTGLLTWCMGLGALVSLLIREKNLLLPVAIFLAGFDVFLVMYPGTPTARIVEQNPAFFQKIAMTVPQVRQEAPAGEAPKVASIEPLAHVGPADLFCIATFFACLFRFRMRVRETVRWLVPVLVVYLVLAFLPIGIGMLPALVPIGLTVLIVNAREFQMTREEKQATWGVAVIALALAIFGVYSRVMHKPTESQAEPSMSDSAPMPPVSAGTPEPASPR